MAPMTIDTGAPIRTTFTRMDESTADDWAEIGRQSAADQPQTAERVMRLLASMDVLVNGFAVDQLTHCLQTAARAEAHGADDELVVASLCHDIGKAISVPDHPAIAAAILRPYVRPEVHWAIAVHQDFQGRHYYQHFGLDPAAREQYRDHPSYELAARFADDWDQLAFDPAFPTPTIDHFADRVRTVFARARY
jgi:predicted HD phosphohydrolase